MKQKRSLFKKIFGTESEEKDKNYTSFKLLSSSSSSFSPWSGNVYDNDIVRSCIRPKTSAVGKLHPVHVRTDGNGDIKINPNPSIKMLLRFPNEYMSMQKLLEKMNNQRELNHNAYAFIKKDALNRPMAIFPIPTSSMELLEYNNDIYAKFKFKIGKTMTVPYADVIHLRKDFNENDMFGSNGSEALSNIMKVIDTTDKGIIKSIKNSTIIRWLMKFKSTLRPEDKQMEVETFTKSYLDIEKAETGGVATTDPRYDIEQVKENSYVPNEGVINSYEKRLKNYFGVSDKIIQNSFSEDEWNAFYEAEIEPIATELGDQLTYKLFTKHEIECGNEIVFEASSLACASMNTKLNLKEMVDRKSMTPNEWRKVMNLGSVDGGDVLLRRLDTGESETLQEKKEEKNENKE